MNVTGAPQTTRLWLDRTTGPECSLRTGHEAQQSIEVSLDSSKSRRRFVFTLTERKRQTVTTRAGWRQITNVITPGRTIPIERRRAGKMTVPGRRQDVRPNSTLQSIGTTARTGVVTTPRRPARSAPVGTVEPAGVVDGPRAATVRRRLTDWSR